MVYVKGTRMIQSCIFLSFSFFCFFMLGPPKKLKDLAPHVPPLVCIQAYPVVDILPMLFSCNSSVTYYQMLDEQSI